MFLILLIILVVVGVVLYVRQTSKVDRGNFNLFVPYLNKFNVFEKGINTYDDWVLFLKYHEEICDFAMNTKPKNTENWYHPNLQTLEGCDNEIYNDMREDVESIDKYRTDGDITGLCSVRYEQPDILHTLFQLLPEEERAAIKEECKNNFNSSQ